MQVVADREQRLRAAQCGDAGVLAGRLGAERLLDEPGSKHLV
jgi:hypothetical protein